MKRSECSTASIRKRTPTTKVTGWRSFPNDTETIQYHLVSSGPLFAAFFVYDNFFEYKSGIYSQAKGELVGGHAVLMTGYGTENGIPYWILKNSFSDQWGERGYFRMQRGIDLCKIESWRVSIPDV